MFSDDPLILDGDADWGAGAVVVLLFGHKRLKLTADEVALAARAANILN